MSDAGLSLIGSGQIYVGASAAPIIAHERLRLVRDTKAVTADTIGLAGHPRRAPLRWGEELLRRKNTRL